MTQAVGALWDILRGLLTREGLMLKPVFLTVFLTVAHHIGAQQFDPEQAHGMHAPTSRADPATPTGPTVLNVVSCSTLLC